MALGLTAIARFGKALQSWVASDATIVSLTGHVPGSDERIVIRRGDDVVNVPCLLLSLVRTVPFLPDVDGVVLSRVEAVAIGTSRVEALRIMGALHKYAKPDRSTYADAGFSTDNVRTRSITGYMIPRQGESDFDITSVRRTERSDAPIPDRHIAIMELYIVWTDTA